MVRAVVLVAASVLASRAAADKTLSADDLRRKNERGYVTAIPLASYSVDFGLGGGARAYYYWNGDRDDPRFARTPYLLRTFLNVFATTRGLQFHWLDLDAPSVFGSQYRIRAQALLARNVNSNYYGFDDAGRAALRFPGSGDTFGSYASYDAAQRRLVGGEAFTKYDQYDLLRPAVLSTVERSLLGDRVRVLGGLGVSYARVRDYTGRTVNAIGDDGSAVRAPQAPTRLREDCDRGALVGCRGGRDHVVKMGITYDTRDFEPDPNAGVHVDLIVEVASRFLGSEYDYARSLFAARGYWSPVPDRADLVLAGRLIVQTQSSGTPFYAMDVLPFIEDIRTGLGGHRTMRGYRQSRFVDHVMSAVSGEVRWTFARTTIKRQKLAFILAPFLDVGRAADDAADLGKLATWRPSVGGAVRVSWNLATLATFDYGWSGEGSGFYVNFGHTF